MKATELRIGNLVRIDEMLRNELFDNNEVITDTDTFQIAMVATDFINLYIKSCEYEFNMIDIQPIPLTEEWLIKFGFEETVHENGNEYELQINYSSGFRDFIALSNKGGVDSPFFLGWLTTNYQKEFVLAKQLEHVHQLQNLYFSLTGEELTIND